MFDGVYYLNLTSRPDRRETMEKRFRYFDMQVERFNAIPGRIVYGYWETINKNVHQYHLNQNSLACAMSHVSIWADALARNRKKILILEDDVRIHRRSEEMTKKFLDEAPPDWDLLYFGYVPLWTNNHRDANSVNDIWDYNIIDKNRISPSMVKADKLWNGSGYALSEKLMRHMVDVYAKSYPKEHDRYFVEDIQTSPDWKSYGVNPQIIAGEDTYSDLINGISDYQGEKSIDRRFAQYHDYV
jgi:GR25 family glycosyltransferase involved in LPS biosynthesis